MNHAKIYSDLVGRGISIDGSPEDTGVGAGDIAGDALPKESQDAARSQLKHQWLASTVTQEFFQSRHREYESLIDQALSCAQGYHAHQNHYQIISILIRALELKKIIKEQQNKPA